MIRALLNQLTVTHALPLVKILSDDADSKRFAKNLDLVAMDVKQHALLSQPTATHATPYILVMSMKSNDAVSKAFAKAFSSKEMKGVHLHAPRNQQVARSALH